MAQSPIRPTDDDARALAQQILRTAPFAALAVIGEDGAPLVTRIAFSLDPGGAPLSLISDLSAHTRALRANPTCSLLIGEPGPKGDPLTHPRLTIQARAEVVAHQDGSYTDLAAHYLKARPKAALYVGFADFHFARFTPSRAFLNGGFGKAFDLTPEDMGFTR